MGVRLLDPDLVRRICGVATVRDIVYDALDDSFWVCMPRPTKAGLALIALNTYGIGGHNLEDGRLHVTGWDDRLLHRRLGGLLDGLGGEAVKFESNRACGVGFHAASPVRWARSLMAAR